MILMGLDLGRAGSFFHIEVLLLAACRGAEVRCIIILTDYLALLAIV